MVEEKKGRRKCGWEKWSQAGWGRHGERFYLGKLRVSKERWYLEDGFFKCSGKMHKSNLFLLYEVVVSNGIRVTGDLSHSLGVFCVQQWGCSAETSSPADLALSGTQLQWPSFSQHGKSWHGRSWGASPVPLLEVRFLGGGLQMLWPGRTWHVDL